MSDLRNYKTVDKIEIKRLKVSTQIIIIINKYSYLLVFVVNFQIKINELEDEEEKLRKIINIVRPTILPELKKPKAEENLLKVEMIPKINSTITANNNSQSFIKPIIPIEVKQIDNKLKPYIEEKIKQEKDDLKETEGIFILILINYIS